jgi:HicB family
MDLRPYIESIHQQLSETAEAGGDEARALAERLAAPLDAAIRLALQDALGAAAAEITVELAPGSVELRLRGRNPEFVVTVAPVEEPVDDFSGASPPSLGAADTDEGGTSRINLRMPDHLKTRIEEAASSEGLSVNTWLVRAASSTLDRAEAGGRGEGRVSRGPGRFTGWVR